MSDPDFRVFDAGEFRPIDDPAPGEPWAAARERFFAGGSCRFGSIDIFIQARDQAPAEATGFGEICVERFSGGQRRLVVVFCRDDRSAMRCVLLLAGGGRSLNERVRHVHRKELESKP